MKGKKRTKKLIAGLFLIFALAFMIVPVKKVQASDGWGTCGSNITWYYHSNSNWLEIKGTGAMPDSCRKAWGSYSEVVKKVTISSGITSVGPSAFSSFKNLSSVTLPKSIKTIGSFAFYYGGMKTINLPEGLVSIGTEAFFSSKLTSVKIPNTTTYLGKSAFESSNDLKTLTLGSRVETIDSGCFKRTGVTAVKFPASVRTINWNAFAFTNVTSVLIPETVTYMGQGVFTCCGNLRYAEFRAGCEVPAYTFTGGNLTTVKFGPKVRYINGNVVDYVSPLSNRTLHFYISSSQTEISWEMHIYRDYYIYATKGSKAWEYCGKYEKANFVDRNSSRGTKAWNSAVAKTKTYKVAFSSSGKTISTSIVSTGGKVSAPKKDPTKKGYTFGGWYNGSKKYNFNSPVKANLTLKAKWIKVVVGKEQITSISNPYQNRVIVNYKKITGSIPIRYEVQYSYSSNFKNAYKRSSNLLYAIFYGKRNKTVYVRVRAFRNDSTGNKVYGAFSSVKKIKIRK